MAKTLIPNKGKDINIKNKRAEFDYLLMDKYTAGLVLTGTEIKSIRKGKASLVDTYCYIIGGEVWVKNMYIAQYEQGSYNNHMERRDRKLLLNRKEIRKMQQTVKSPGFSIVPTLLFVDEKGLAKLDIQTSARHSRRKKTAATLTVNSRRTIRVRYPH